MLRREAGTGAPVEKDSLYKPIERVPRVFPALRVPKSLQSELPFKSKPKVEVARTRKTLDQKRAVVMEKQEKQVRLYGLPENLLLIRHLGGLFA